MPSLFDSSRRAALQHRIERLSPSARGRWGRLTVSQMVCHVADQLRVALGDLDTEPKAGPLRLLRYRALREIPVYWLPWSKGRITTAPEMLSAHPGEWHEDVRRLHQLIDRFGEQSPAAAWPPHPLFGPMSGGEWGRLCWKHLDYHLRQFGA